jgi:hypothetical protein
MDFRVLNGLFGLLMAVCALTIWFDPGRAPATLFLILVATALPWREGWRGAHGTALRPALIWAALALALLSFSQIVALCERLEAGRPQTGRITYLAVLAALAALISVLNARTPGAKVWAGLMALLIVVLLIPWLEEPGRIRRADGLTQLYLSSPWTLFYGLLVIVAVTNYLPTRYGAAAACAALGFMIEYSSLTVVDWPAERRARLWEWVALTFAMSVWVARWCAERSPATRDFDVLWCWFRDCWGVVWALRVRERFNREAELAGWPVRLTWFGLEPVASVDGSARFDVPAQAEATLRGLIRRFALPWRLDQVNASRCQTSCDPSEVARR